MPPTPTNPAALLREAADRLRDVAPQISGPLAGLADPVADWLEAEAAAPITAQHSTRCVDPQCTTLAALTVARRVLGTTTGQHACGNCDGVDPDTCLTNPERITTGQPATAPWPPAVVARPDHELYVTLRKAGLDPAPAQQMIDTYTQTILASGDGLRARCEALAADWEKRGEYGDASLTWGARGIRAVLAAEAQQPTPAKTEATATLVINRSDSYCDGCGKPTLPKRTHHTDISGWTPKPGGGCGARFTATRSDYRGITADDLKDVRPDLPVATPPATPDVAEEPAP
ncbi:hypothetical protein ACFWXI_06690 [[Kitasatospora] papulosa]|uniref:hypothetical protein n=1 Tax=[Kitasatospora] papulosa TaxID=1464011 RepID=UPI00367EC098